MFEGVERVVTKTELIEACSYDSHDKRDTAFIQHQTICFEYMDRVGVLQFSKWYTLSKMIQRRNVLCIDSVELMNAVGFTSRSKMSVWVTQMTAIGMLIVTYPEGVKSDKRVVYFNPNLVWKGSYRVRNRYRYLWNKMKGYNVYSE